MVLLSLFFLKDYALLAIFLRHEFEDNNNLTLWRDENKSKKTKALPAVTVVLGKAAACSLFLQFVYRGLKVNPRMSQQFQGTTAINHHK